MQGEVIAMPKLTLLLGRRTLQVYDFKQPSIIVGRDDAADVMIDNPSVSRRHAEIRLGDDGTWMVVDLDSSNGTFLDGQRITGPRSLTLGTEIGFGKFSILFGKAVGDRPVGAPAAATAGSASRSQPVTAGAEGTMHIKPHEVKELLQDSGRQRRAQFDWESGGRRGTHFLSEDPAVLVGTDDICDLRVPKGPKRHLLLVHRGSGCDARYLGTFGSMSVRGRSTRRATLRDGDVLEVSGLKITYRAEVA
jgi:hypothetical protein